MPTNIQIITEIFARNPIPQGIKASSLIKDYYQLYLEQFGSNPSVNGAVFEELITITLLREGFEPIYTQAEMAFVPNAIFDILIYNRHRPITFSAKVSLRERWKQADLEASALKFVHRRAEAYVLSLSESEINSRRKDSNSYIAIDAFILASSTELDELLKNLKSRIEIQESETIDIVSHAQRCRIDKELINSKYGLWL